MLCNLCLNDQPTEPSNAVVFPEIHGGHHVLDCMCLNREGWGWGRGGGWILIQFHFKMCKMKHYSLLFPFFPSPLPPASFRFISVYDLACLDVAMYRLMMYTLVHGYEGCHCPFLPRVVQSHFSYIMDQIAAGGFSQLKQSIL